MMFCLTNWFQRKSNFKRKNIINKNKKLPRKHVCFPFHHDTCTRRVFEFCFRNCRKRLPLLTFITDNVQKTEEVNEAALRVTKFPSRNPTFRVGNQLEKKRVLKTKVHVLDTTRNTAFCSLLSKYHLRLSFLMCFHHKILQ